MRQVTKPQPRAKLDELADSLVARELAAAQIDPAARVHGISDISELVYAGQVAGQGDTIPGIPYDGALERLIRIYREAKPLDVRLSALGGLLDVAGHAQAIAFLREVAISADPTAWYAVGQLEAAADPADARPVGTVADRRAVYDLLKALFQQRLVSEPLAADGLDLYAHNQGWTRP